jgi:hypothetical protein
MTIFTQTRTVINHDSKVLLASSVVGTAIRIFYLSILSSKLCFIPFVSRKAWCVNKDVFESRPIMYLTTPTRWYFVHSTCKATNFVITLIVKMEQNTIWNSWSSFHPKIIFFIDSTSITFLKCQQSSNNILLTLLLVSETHQHLKTAIQKQFIKNFSKYKLQWEIIVLYVGILYPISWSILT